MIRGNVKLQKPELFTDGFEIPEEKLRKALDSAIMKLRNKAEKYKDGYPSNFTTNCRYNLGSNDNWIHGMLTGCYLLAYEATGDEFFLDIAKHQLKSYEDRITNDIGLSDHDVGFVYSPSCVAYYKITGDEYAKDLALKAANILYGRCYTEKGGFILRLAGAKNSLDPKCANGCRTIMDTMMNAPLFFWAYDMTGDEKFKNAALSQCDITNKYLIREDGSSYHHYQFELGTYKALYGLTLQGNSAESTWSRGHTWAITGYPIAYRYSHEKYIMPLHRDVTYYYLNHLPEDYIPYWDFDFMTGDEPRDSSAGVTAVCGMLEGAKTLPYSDEEKDILTTAAHKILNSVIDRYTTETGEEYDGLITGVTAARKIAKYPIEECALYGDYFYLEALVRLLKNDFDRYW